MAPVRRYLRITKYSVLECRIYVDNPALVQSWLLHPRDPVLPRVMESVRPLVLPKLMEERDRARKKGASKKNKGAIRDVLVEKDFEVSLFLVETNTRHSLLYKHRRARDKTQTRLVSNSSKLTGGATNDAPIDVDVDAAADIGMELGGGGHEDGHGEAAGLPRATGASASPPPPPPPPHLLVEDSDGEDGSGRKALQTIPDIHEARPDATSTPRRSKRRRNQSNPVHVDDSDDEDHGSLFGSDGGDNGVASDDDDDDNDNDPDADGARPPKKRSRVVPVSEGGDMAGDGDEGGRKKKKLAMDVIYEGFAIYGRVLCLVVKQRGAPPRGRSIRSMLPPPAATSSRAATAATQTPGQPEGHAAMENWIASTQMPLGDGADD